MDKNRYFGFPSVSHRKSFICGRCLRLRNFGGVYSGFASEHLGSNILIENRGSNILDRESWIEHLGAIFLDRANILDCESWIEHLGSTFFQNILVSLTFGILYRSLRHTSRYR